MADKVLKLINGIPRMTEITSTLPNIYDESLTVVASGAGAGEINVEDVQSVSNITLPNSGNFTGSELLVYLNGQFLEPTSDYTYVGSGTMTQISFTFDLSVGQVIRFLKLRNE